ncbi:hypothetical protein GCM10009676_06740 [Prauserella halophila]|uniref:Uncharacterized protein n=1 Tax=Prauserella halophila TaxID=185641 RepID=A0ABP4GN78_9PSEU|nr:hypothetical protein [Prauserella halophila]MCP2237275.1 hypothetical protein [Prauserella halophila]
MGETDEPQGSGDERVISTPEEFAAAVGNWMSDRNTNDADISQFIANTVAEVRQWRDQRYQHQRPVGEDLGTSQVGGDDDLPRRASFSGVLLPQPLEPLHFETNPDVLQRVLEGLYNLPIDPGGAP